MSSNTVAFALALNPTYFRLMTAGTKHSICWTDCGHGKKRLSFDISVRHDFDEEGDAWRAATSHFPATLDMLKRSNSLADRGYALRGEMFLKLGHARVQSMVDDLHAEVFRIYELAMEVLDAVKVTKAKPKVTRVSPAKALSWLEVRSRVTTPYESEPVLLSVRCLPSAVEEKTWAVRLRFATTSDASLLDTQRRYEELVTRLRYQGITVKDVQNGTCIDL